MTAPLTFPAAVRERIRSATPVLAALAGNERPIDRLLSRLNKVKRVGDGRWIACCPAHADHYPSLSIAEKEGGVVLIHDFGGCEVGGVLAAVGLQVADLFPTGYRKAGSGSLPSWRRDKLQAALDHELLVIELAHGDLSAGKELSAEDAARVQLASDRVGVLRRRLRDER